MKVSRYVAGLSIAAKIALGAGCVFAATATAGATGVLPGPVQEAVDSVTPFGSGDGAPGAIAPSTTTAAGDGSTPVGGTVTTVVPTGDGAGAGTGTGTEPTHDTPPPTTAPTPTTAPPVDAPASGGGTPVVSPPVETPVAQSMEIHCAVNDGHTAVTCEWTTALPEGFGTYVLLRTSDDGKAGRVLVQTGDITAHTWTDSLALTPGVAYSYMVDTIAPDGSTTGHSNRVTVTF